MRLLSVWPGSGIRLFVPFLLLAFACTSPNRPIFEYQSKEVTGINFINTIEETDSFNVLVDEYIYNGGGVGIADFNQDGLMDIYFTGNIVSNQLYLNRGNFRFEDVTAQAGVGAGDIWSSGICIVDINNDGWQDMYVSATFKTGEGTRKNKLFINQGLKDGIPWFTDQAEKYGIADDGHSTQSVFFDSDLDGDLDLYVLTNVFLKRRTAGFEPRDFQGNSETTDRFYRNNGDGTFTDVSKEAGILIEGFGLSIGVFDVNHDLYPDLYISNDFITNDILYINNGDGTFSNRITRYLQHQSFASMGMDISDVNNDAFPDIMTLEMLPATNYRMKQMYNGTNIYLNEVLKDTGYEPQQMRNCLHLNNGNQTFSDISMLLGVHDTEWSWSVLFMDYDNNGWRDISIANGFPMDVTDHDFSDLRNSRKGSFLTMREKLDMIPPVFVKNFLFSQNNRLQFENVSESWMHPEKSFSSGAAFADLDNDGDMDYITNNINSYAYVIKNFSTEIYPGRNWIKFKLEGDSLNRNGIGTKITLYYKNHLQYYEHYPYRGYISTVDPVIHFGLDTLSLIDSLHIIWPSGKFQSLYHLPVRQTLVLKADNANERLPGENNTTPIFQNIHTIPGLDFQHTDQLFLEFRIQRLMPHMHSHDGPALAVGDVNGDGLEDLIVGNGRRADAIGFLQNNDNSFSSIVISDTTDSEDTGMLLFDADNDGDLDLYMVSGSSEFLAHSWNFRDRLLMNDGRGNFTYDPAALPEIFIAGSLATAADFDKDGDLDLFIGGRLIPQNYPFPERSILLRNDGGRFIDITESVCPLWMNFGMVTSALWTDYDQDGWVDLLTVGEWMGIRLFKNVDGIFQEVTGKAGLDKTHGWWRSINSADFDKDGDLDYVVGNQGLNHRYKPLPGKPVTVIAKDFDNNGSVDPIISWWREGNYYPVHLKNDIQIQLPELKRKFPTFHSYSVATTSDLFTREELKGAYSNYAEMFETIILKNNGKGQFEIIKLPLEVQFAPVFGILTGDFDHDNQTDLLLTGNNFSTELFNGKHDAFIGLFLKGNGEGELEPVSVNQSGFFVNGDAKAMVSLITGQGNQLIVVSRNNSDLKIHGINASRNDWIWLTPEPSERMAVYYNQDGSMESHEIYYGSSYLSCSSRKLSVNKKYTSRIELIRYDGSTRTWTHPD